MPEDGVRPRPDDGNDVEPGLFPRIPRDRAEVCSRGGDDLPPLDRSHRLLRRAESLPFAESHFDENEDVSLPRDEVDLTPSGAEVALHDPEPRGLEERAGRRFRFGPGLPRGFRRMTHGWVITPRNVFRWIGQGPRRRRAAT